MAERAIAAQPIVGLGNDNFSLMSSHFLVQPGATTRADQIVTLAQPAHNIYLEIWADLGIVGLVLFAGVVLAALRAALAAAALLEAAGRRAEELLARALTVAIVAMLAADFFISNEYSKQLWLLLALAPAMLAATCTDSRAAPASRRARPCPSPSRALRVAHRRRLMPVGPGRRGKHCGGDRTA